QSVRAFRDSSELNTPRRKVDEEENHETLVLFPTSLYRSGSALQTRTLIGGPRRTFCDVQLGLLPSAHVAPLTRIAGRLATTPHGQNDHPCRQVSRRKPPRVCA